MNHKIAIDLGCATLIAAEAGAGILHREPSVIAINRKTGQVLAVGAESQNSAIKDAQNSVLMRPFRSGITNNPDITYHVLNTMLKRAFPYPIRGAKLLMSIPCDMSSLEESILIELALKAGVKSCHLIYSPIAAMASAFISPFSECLLVDIGAARTNIMLLCKGNILYKKTIAAGGEKFDSAIAAYVVKKHKLQISLKTAETLKLHIGTVWDRKNGELLEDTVTGKKLEDGELSDACIHASEMYEALEEPVAEVLEAICIAISKIPPQHVRGVFDMGIMLCGGGANLSGIAKMIAGVTGVKATVMDDPEDAVATGLAKIEEWLPSQVPDSVRNLSRFYIENFIVMQ